MFQIPELFPCILALALPTPSPPFNGGGREGETQPILLLISFFVEVVAGPEWAVTWDGMETGRQKKNRKGPCAA